ncbi:MAG TPA: hypothetical protein VJ927_04315 [Actinomycetota bacterium]|nr:hypothetical protein [Actinomycetota bacterium]
MGMIAALVVPAPAAAAPPANDSFESPVVVESVPFTHTQSLAEATVSFDDPGCFGMNRTVWYRFTPTEDIRVIASVAGSNVQAAVGLFTGESGSQTTLACDREIRSDLQAGQPYHFMVGAIEPEGDRSLLTFSLTLPPPPPPIDSVTTPRIISSLPFRTTVDTREATVASGEPSCANSTHTVWFSHRSIRDQTLLAATRRSNYDTAIGIWVMRFGEPVFVDCMDDLFRNRLARIRFEAQEGRNYLFGVGSESGFGGNLNFSLERPPPKLRVRLSVNEVGMVNTVTGAARISGWLRCTRKGTHVTLSGGARQVRGNRIATADGDRLHFQTKECGPKRMKWSDQLADSEYPYRQGLIGLRILATATHDEVHDKKKFAGPVRLQSCTCIW